MYTAVRECSYQPRYLIRLFLYSLCGTVLFHVYQTTSKAETLTRENILMG
jgi:hypothetical protein